MVVFVVITASVGAVTFRALSARGMSAGKERGKGLHRHVQQCGHFAVNSVARHRIGPGRVDVYMYVAICVLISIRMLVYVYLI